VIEEVEYLDGIKSEGGMSSCAELPTTTSNPQESATVPVSAYEAKISRPDEGEKDH